MAYLIYVENVLMPVTPSKITRKVPGKNEEIELLGGKTVLNLQEPGLTEWSMDFLLPKTKYPFVNIISDKQELRSQDFYLTHFNTLMAKAKPFDFMIIRTKPNGVWDLGEENGTFKIDIPNNDTENPVYVNDLDGILNKCKCTIEEFTDEDNTDNGFDKVISVTFKKYLDYSTKTVKLVTDKKTNKTTATTVKARDTSSKTTPSTYTVKPGDYLILICKKELGDGSKWKEVYNLNKDKIKNPNLIYPGQVLKLK
jgi:LysM repeat protein